MLVQCDITYTICYTDQLRSLQTASRMSSAAPPPPHHLQRSEDELDRLTNALKRHGIECTSTLRHAYSAYANKTASSARRLFRQTSHSAGSGSSQGVSDDPACCTHSTHRCHHAAHAYTGVPCHNGNRKFIFISGLEKGRDAFLMIKSIQSLNLLFIDYL